MFIKLSLVLLSIIYLAKSADIDEFVKQGIIPDVIDDVPKSVAEVVFLKSNRSVDLGNELTPADTANQPLVKWNADENTSYTILMVDPDAPSRQNPAMRNMLHWIVGNVPGGNITAGNTIADYMGPMPPAGVGVHRYVVLVYEQPQSSIDYSQLDIGNKMNFNVRNLTSTFNLGVPLGGNFFVAQTLQ